MLVDSDLSGDVARVLAGLMLLFGPDFFLPDFFFALFFARFFGLGFLPIFRPRFFAPIFRPIFRPGFSLRGFFAAMHRAEDHECRGGKEETRGRQ